jgi:hypothetical protein
MELRIGTQHYPLAQIGGEKLIFDHKVVLPGTEGEVILHIDEHERRWRAAWDPSNSPRQVVPAQLTNT